MGLALEVVVEKAILSSAKLVSVTSGRHSQRNVCDIGYVVICFLWFLDMGASVFGDFLSCKSVARHARKLVVMPFRKDI